MNVIMINIQIRLYFDLECLRSSYSNQCMARYGGINILRSNLFYFFTCKLEEYHNQKRWFCGGQKIWLACIHHGNYYCYVQIIFFSFYCVYFFFLFVYSLFNKWPGLYIDIVCSTSLSLSVNFDNNVKQVIYNLGKYMR